MTRPAGAVALSDRALAPDLARGAMLLLIALANAHVWRYGHPLGVRGYPVGPTGPDALVTVAQLVLVDGRAYPLFGLLFGYGITQLATRGGAAGVATDAVVRLVRRRGAWMVAIGLAHGVLLWSGDVVGAYGLLAVLLAGVLVRASAGTLAGIAAGGTLVSVVFSAPAVAPRPDLTTTLPSTAMSSWAAAMANRVVEWVAQGLTISTLVTAGAVALGALAARRRLLDDPGRHRTLLVRVAAGGLGAAVALGLPTALAAVGAWAPSTSSLLLAGLLHALGGYAGGVGYAALFGLLALRSGARPGPVARALRASGRRSLSCYLAQSVALAVLMPAWGLGLGARLGVAQTALLATLVWLTILLAAVASERAGWRGPAETLLRRLTYGPAARR